MKKILTILLVVALMATVTTTVLADPKSKISSDTYFMGIFDPDHAKDVQYKFGEKEANAITSNSHYNDYADMGFWFIWADDLEIDAKQKENCYAVIEGKYFDLYDSLTIVVKSSSMYAYATFTEAGTYRIDKYFEKNEDKVMDAEKAAKEAEKALKETEKDKDKNKEKEVEYHNINWIGFALGNPKDPGFDNDPDIKKLRDYYAICQIWNDLVWGYDYDIKPGGLELFYPEFNVTQEQKDAMMPIGIAHREALQAFWGIEEMNVRYLPVSSGNYDFYEIWGDKIRESMEEVCAFFKIDIDAFIEAYDVDGFLTENGLW